MPAFRTMAGLDILITSGGRQVVVLGWKEIPGPPVVLARYLVEQEVRVRRPRVYSPMRMIPCRTCGAGEGEACIMHKGTEWEGATQWHKARRRDAKAGAT